MEEEIYYYIDKVNSALYGYIVIAVLALNI